MESSYVFIAYEGKIKPLILRATRLIQQVVFRWTEINGMYAEDFCLFTYLEIFISKKTETYYLEQNKQNKFIRASLIKYF